MFDLRTVGKFIGRSARRVAITIAGIGLVGIGLVMLVTPGPGLVAIVAGLALLATEYAWAQRALEQARERSKQTVRKVRGRRNSKSGA